MGVLNNWDLLNDTLLVIVLIITPFMFGYLVNNGKIISKKEKWCFIYSWSFAALIAVWRFVEVCLILK